MGRYWIEVSNWVHMKTCNIRFSLFLQYWLLVVKSVYLFSPVVIQLLNVEWEMLFKQKCEKEKSEKWALGKITMKSCQA